MRAIATLADAVQGRLTTPARLRDALDSRTRIRRRPLLSGVLHDLELGACSVLEHGYLTRVERAHGLAAADRQVRDSLRGLDLERDLDTAVTGRLTVRLGWGQVFDRPCSTAAALGAIARQRGWTGALRGCPNCPGGSVPTIQVTR